MSERFFVDAPIDPAEPVRLDGVEAHHLLHVMRARVGDQVVLFDGGGAEFPAELLAKDRQSATLRVLEERRVDRESPTRLVMGVALPKGDRQRWLVEKLTELGVATLVPLETRRNVAEGNEKSRERLRRAVIEASKQCGRNRLMTIETPLNWREFLKSATSDATRWVADPLGEPIANSSSATEVGVQASTVWLAIGPEGGWDESELVAAVEAGWRRVSLGPRILRIETAALALASHWLLGGRP